MEITVYTNPLPPEWDELTTGEKWIVAGIAIFIVGLVAGLLSPFLWHLL